MALGCCGTMRGAGAGPSGLDRRLELESGDSWRDSWRFSKRTDEAGAFCSARASATGSAVSPSKNFDIAIWMGSDQCFMSEGEGTDLNVPF